jgi:hypothetical protein
MISGLSRNLTTNEAKLNHAFHEFLLVMVYAQLASPAAPVKISLLIRNIGFILRQTPFATRKAILHYNKATQICRDCGYNGLLGKVHLELGRLYQQKGKKEPAWENLSAAVRLCRECEDTGSLIQAEALLESLEKRDNR